MVKVVQLHLQRWKSDTQPLLRSNCSPMLLQLAISFWSIHFFYEWHRTLPYAWVVRLLLRSFFARQRKVFHFARFRFSGDVAGATQPQPRNQEQKKMWITAKLKIPRPIHRKQGPVSVRLADADGYQCVEPNCVSLHVPLLISVSSSSASFFSDISMITLPDLGLPSAWQGMTHSPRSKYLRYIEQGT